MVERQGRGGVERHDGERHAGGEHGLRRGDVGLEIPLGLRLRLAVVADRDRPAHDDDPLQLLRRVGAVLQQPGDVRQWAEGDHGQLALVLVREPGHQLDRGLRGRLQRAVVDRGRVPAVLHLSVHQQPRLRVGARGHGHRLDADLRQEPADEPRPVLVAVRRDVPHERVAAVRPDGRDADDPQLRRRDRQRESERVVDVRADVGVDEHGDRPGRRGGRQGRDGEPDQEQAQRSHGSPSGRLRDRIVALRTIPKAPRPRGGDGDPSGR